MKTSLIGLCAWLLLAFAVAAQNSGPASNGDFQFSLEGASGAIQYDARGLGSSAHGQITFTGTQDISGEDVDGTGTGDTGTISNVTMSVNVDCLRINGNRAAMSGVVTSSSVPDYVGVRAVLAVEDNGEGHNAPLDRFTWGVYRTAAMTWMPSDAEVPGDNGWMFSWIATDFEQPDDAGVPSSHGGGPVDCQTFPFGSYAFSDVPHGGGNIQVKP